MIKAFLIDLFDTLVFIKESEYRSWRSEMADFLHAPHDKFLEVWWEYTTDRFLGKIENVPEMIGIMASRFNVTLSKDEIEQISKRELEKLVEISNLYPGTKETLDKMRQDGFLLALVSNASSGVRNIIQALDIERCFDAIILSCEVGVAKPDEKIYEIAMAQLSVSPSECIFIGDGACQELDGANRAGIKTIRICQTPQTTVFGKSEKFDYTISSLSEAIKIGGDNNF